MTDHFIYLIFSILNAIYYYPSSDLLSLYCYVQEKAVLHHPGFVRGITKSYKVLYLFLKNKTSYKVLYFIGSLIFFWQVLHFLTSLILCHILAVSYQLKTRTCNTRYWDLFMMTHFHCGHSTRVVTSASVHTTHRPTVRSSMCYCYCHPLVKCRKCYTVLRRNLAYSAYNCKETVVSIILWS